MDDGRSLFRRHESEVRSYCRDFPQTFESARGSYLYTDRGRPVLDFLSGAGALNYGHNNEFIRNRVVQYLKDDGVVHALDFHTTAKRTFIERFVATVLEPEGLSYRMQFCGPTGTNAVEAALKLARLKTRRSGVIAFSGAFHGVTLGSLSATANRFYRSASGVTASGVHFLPYENAIEGVDSLSLLRETLADEHSGVDLPAAVLVETVQGEGGVNIASNGWLRGVRDLCTEYGALLIVDDIQAGCGRTGPFFSFTRAGIKPDLVALSKSISGLGLPMALLLIDEECDWRTPGHHNGTFRGHQLAFVAAEAALQLRTQLDLGSRVREGARVIESSLSRACRSADLELRGIGMIWGIDARRRGRAFASHVAEECRRRGLLIEQCGRGGCVIKVMPALTIQRDELLAGCVILRRAIRASVAQDATDAREIEVHRAIHG